MDLRFEKWYDKKITKINKLREDLRKDPKNSKLQASIEVEEKLLFEYVMNSSKELEKMVQRDKEESYDNE